jgi:LacI family transcriptional regulator
MLRWNVDGMVLIPARFRRSRLTRALFGKTPVVAFDRPGHRPSFDVVLVQNTTGARRMVEHLIEHGHQAHRLYGTQPRPVYHQRPLSRLSPRDAGCGPEEDAFFGCDSQQDTLQAIEEKLHGADPPTAFFASNTSGNALCSCALMNLGVKMPNDLAFAGFDDFDLADLTSPPLTVVRQPTQEMGRVAPICSSTASSAASCPRPETGSFCRSRSCCAALADASTAPRL